MPQGKKRRNKKEISDSVITKLCEKSFDHPSNELVNVRSANA